MRSTFLGAPASRPPLPPGPFLIVGLGRAGFSAARVLAARRGPENVRAWDSSADTAQQRHAAELRALGVEVRLGGDGLDLLDGVATLVKSPGATPAIPLVRAALDRGLGLFGEFEIGWQLIPAPTVGVTGTKGKSTVSALSTAILAAHRLRPALCGNTSFGAAITEIVTDPPGTLVAEISSYQLEFSHELWADAAILTNLAYDHLDRHGTMADYAAAKRKLFVRDDAAVPFAALNADDDFGARLAGEVEERGGRVLRYGRGEAADYRIAACRWDLHGAEVEVETPAGRVEFTTRLPGLHNAANATAVLALADGSASRASRPSPRSPARSRSPAASKRCRSRRPSTWSSTRVKPGPGSPRHWKTVRPVVAARGGRLIAVLSMVGYFGVEHGLRNGAIARELADHLILAGSSYRGEPRVPALAALAAGARGADGAELEIFIDRRKAIARAIDLARPGDVVVLLGRGQLPHEATDRRGGFVELRDRVVAAELARGQGDAPHS